MSTRRRKVWSIEALRILKNKAAAQRSNKEFMDCDWLYRNKDPDYWHDIRLNYDNIIPTRLKDDNGDPKCPINNNFYGIFFCANVNRYDGEPCRQSPFGSKRLCVPAEMLLNDDMNLYFADFYCLYSAHYVTLVIAKKYSHEDMVLANKLLKLDLYNNQFLRVKSAYDEQVEVTVGGTWVEVLYAHDLDINDVIESGGYFRRKGITVTYRGKPTPGGLPKREDCNICNL